MTCLELIKFGMSSTLVTFCDKYYQYHGGNKEGERGLAIGGYKSAFLADVVASYLMEATQDLFGEEHPYKGVYHDNGIYVSNGKWTADNLRIWLRLFQEKVNAIAGLKHVKFMGALWDWTIQRDLMKNFSVYRKPNQKLKYVPANSTHMRATLRAIPTGVLLCLARLTFPSLLSDNRLMETIHANNANALCKEHLSPKIFPTLAQLWEGEED
eukprot:CAMPEP_0172518488 /NCGR_PEP_ID=MMETSP1066-20121228/290852_1 /TAXON_ID=671091 /ORGANISM="Coscinodiscus wailesii, Strain CCMP2513" /LENGTH=211 /DNA_ID=CAMNT_0013300897 /DNA_START=1697 /DNA_END=2333 /DNA_ORIENTATION=-